MTLIEVMVGMALLIIAASGIGWKVHGMIVKKRFASNVERIRSRFLTCHRIAFNMQCDWIADIECDGKKVFFRVSCRENPKVLDLPPLALDSLEMRWEGERVSKISFEFAASGDIFPHGRLEIRNEDVGKVEWKLPDFFSLYTGKTRGPIHPMEYQ